MKSLLLGTRNPGKLKEIKSILADCGWSFSSLQEFSDVGAAEENGTTYAENAIAKARVYALATGMCALADDSGFEVEALAGAPGVFSARYAGENASDADRRALLLAELAKTNSASRRARFVAAVAISDAKGSVLNVSEGISEGTIILSPRGDGGFGYDPLFVPDGYDQTFAELPDSVKNRISHRARALMKTLEFLTTCKSC
ncbi:MAG TPA: RdgB/HAM1 family non-canonical purine NTP pyrophosphatase [Pyrinomonadaceae bacterium]|jgi:XTP/dITP diphosphohydrolase|nr:RdgB/HAM1 family non-canonical purine NTP pyrophosphatase [Pyrinomonadaceae bacterium]